MRWQVDKDEAGTVTQQDTLQQDASVDRRVVGISLVIEQRLVELAATAEVTSRGIARKQLLPDELADNDQAALQHNNNRAT